MSGGRKGTVHGVSWGTLGRAVGLVLSCHELFAVHSGSCAL